MKPHLSVQRSNGTLFSRRPNLFFDPTKREMRSSEEIPEHGALGQAFVVGEFRFGHINPFGAFYSAQNLHTLGALIRWEARISPMTIQS